MRKRLWQIHSWLGLVGGLGLLVIGLTGSLLVFREEVEAWVNPELVRVTPTDSGRLSLDVLRARAEAQLPQYALTGWLPRYDEPEQADVLYLIERGQNTWLIATLDPYTGEVLASPRLDSSTFTGWVLELHYAFFADHTGMIIVGVFGLVLCVLGVTGLFIYRTFWKHVFTLRWDRGARLLFSDLHKFVGITTTAFNLILGFTGAYWNISHVAHHWVHGDPPQPVIAEPLYPPALSLDALVADAAQRLPGFRANFISLPSDPAELSLTFWGAVEPRSAFRGPYGSTVVYDPTTSAHRSTTDLRTQGVWTQVVDAFTPLHFGTFGGLASQILWTLVGLTPGVLAVSGFIIWYSRRGKPAREPRSEAAGRPHTTPEPALVPRR